MRHPFRQGLLSPSRPSVSPDLATQLRYGVVGRWRRGLQIDHALRFDNAQHRFVKRNSSVFGGMAVEPHDHNQIVLRTAIPGGLKP